MLSPFAGALRTTHPPVNDRTCLCDALTPSRKTWSAITDGHEIVEVNARIFKSIRANGERCEVP